MAILPDADMTRSLAGSRRAEPMALPSRVKPQLTKLVDEPPEGPEWLHRLDRGLDWTRKYPAIAAAVASVPATQAYLDGELCGIRPDGTTLIQPDPERVGYG
jgi:ATP-dependent DNA ligase